MITCFQLETNVLNPLEQTLSSVSPRESVPATVADAVADRRSWAEGRFGCTCSPLAVSQHGDVSQECLVASVSHSTKAVVNVEQVRTFLYSVWLLNVLGSKRN